MENSKSEIEAEYLKTLSSLIFEIQSKSPQDIFKKDSMLEIENKISNSKALTSNSVLILCEHLSTYLKTMNELKTTTPYNSLNHVVGYLSKKNWCGPSDITNLINLEDIIEIYDHQGLQIYRCFNFFKYSSYSFSDIITHHWWDLYERNPFIGKTLGDLAVKIFSQNLKDPIHLDLPIHKTSEIWSLKKGIATLRHKNLIPIRDANERTVAVIAPIQVIDFHFKQSASDDFANDHLSFL